MTMGISRSFPFGFLGGLALLLLVQAQDQSDFISLDCGSPANTRYTETTTSIKYISDASYINSGVSGSVAVQYRDTYPRQMRHLRSFPQGIRSCYTVNVVNDTKYLIRASFLYGNYDGLSSLPKFDLYIGNSLWETVSFTNIGIDVFKDIIHTTVSNKLQMCLINTNNGVPFISALEFRPLPSVAYQTASGSLSLNFRLDIGSRENQSYRFPFDIFDRIWTPYNFNEWTQISTNLTVDSDWHNDHQLPSIVMETASIPTKANYSLDMLWDAEEESQQYYIFIHFAEVEELKANQSRGFDITHNGGLYYGPLTPEYLATTTIFSPFPIEEAKTHKISIFQIENSTLPPIFNAFETYTVKDISELETDQADVDAITNIKIKYGVKKDWQGDPCVPLGYPWSGLTCTKDTVPKIISLNLSASGLMGEISPYIANLAMLLTLDLSYNELTGPIPEFLAHLPRLRTLNLIGNEFTGLIPEALIQKSRNGTLILSLNKNQELCLSPPCKKENKFLIPLLASIIPAFVIISLLVIFTRKIKEKLFGSKKKGRLELKNQQFSYLDVLSITDNFKTTIGSGGFGKVYLGKLKDETPVAVKLLSASSNQGSNEFQAEARLLMIVHHRNLVALFGYCDDGDYKALIYEYMANGNVLEHISERSSNVLNWMERLQIAVDTAQGLEYLHNGCKPPIIHRDMKTSNILLNEKMQAKIADFGLSRILSSESASHLTTTPAGTFGYMDPKAHASGKFTKKSDVYSFGIVLLELITGKQAVIRSEEGIVHIINWIKPLIEEGNIENIVDSRLRDSIENCSAWKAIEIGVSCTLPSMEQRPDMSCVLIELSECLKIVQPRAQEISLENHENCSNATIGSESILTPR